MGTLVSTFEYAVKFLSKYKKTYFFNLLLVILHKIFKVSAMKGLLKGGRGFLLGIILVGLSSWGFLVHRTIHQLAVYELPAEIKPFFYKNIEKIDKDIILLIRPAGMGSALG